MSFISVVPCGPKPASRVLDDSAQSFFAKGLTIKNQADGSGLPHVHPPSLRVGNFWRFLLETTVEDDLRRLVLEDSRIRPLKADHSIGEEADSPPLPNKGGLGVHLRLHRGDGKHWVSWVTGFKVAGKR